MRPPFCSSARKLAANRDSLCRKILGLWKKLILIMEVVCLSLVSAGSNLYALQDSTRIPAKADRAKSYSIQLLGMGLRPGDGITVMVHSLDGKRLPELENEVVNCIVHSFTKTEPVELRMVWPDEFRRIAFPGAKPEEVMLASWDQLLIEPKFQQRLASLELRYFVAVSVSKASAPSAAHGYPWRRHESIAMSAKVVDLQRAEIAGKMTISVESPSAAGSDSVPADLPSAIQNEACEIFGDALAAFLMIEESPPPIIASSLTIRNLFPRNRPAPDVEIISSRFASARPVTGDLESGVGLDDLIEPDATAEADGDLTPTRERDSTRSVPKTAIDYTVLKVGARPFQYDLCDEVKQSLNVLTLSDRPLSSPWHIAPLWIAKAASLPLQLAIPMTAVMLAPLDPTTAAWGLETFRNCLPERQGDEPTHRDGPVD